jgi:hypothetical protein
MNSLLGASALTVVALAGIVLYAQHSVQVNDTHDMQQAELHCHFARYYAELDSRWRDSPEKIQQTTSGVDAACDEFHKMRADAEARQVARDQPDNMQDTVGQIMRKFATRFPW